MKKRIFSRALALIMALSLLSTTALADVSFDVLQDAINDTAGTIDAPAYYGREEGATEGGVAAWTQDDTRNVQLNDNAVATETTSTITVEGNVNLDMNGNNITGDGENDVISVEKDASLTVSGTESKDDADTITGNVYNDGTLTVNDAKIDGDVKNNNTFYLDNSSVTGTVFNSFNSTFEMDNTSTVGKEEKLPSGKHSTSGTWHLESRKNSDGYRLVVNGNENGEVVSNVINSTPSQYRNEITEVAFSANVKTIGQSTFQSCTNLKRITFAEDSQLETIVQYAFLGSGLEGTIEFPASLKTIGYRAFKGTNITAIEFPKDSKLDDIGKDSFANCDALKSVSLPDNLQRIGELTFNDCDALEEITIPASVKVIGSQAFDYCDLLKTVNLSEGLETIGSTAFRSCALTSVHIPASVTTIGSLAFKMCKQLGEVTFAENSQLTTIGYDAFLYSGLSGKVVIPDSVTSIGQSAFAGCPDLTEIVLPSNEAFREISTVLFTSDSSLKFLEIPSTVTTVAETAFIASGLKGVVLTLKEDETIDSVSSVVGDLRTATNFKEEAGRQRSCYCNFYVVNDDGDVFFYRGVVSTDFNCDASYEIDKTDGSVELTNVSGTITVGEDEVTLPNVEGITASIDTDGNITVNVPGAITVGEEECPYGAIITIQPDGTVEVEALPEPPAEEEPDAGIVVTPDFTFDAAGADAATTIEDDEVPLAGLLTLASLLEELRQYEEIEDVELPEDFEWIDHEYAQAIYWGLQEKLVVDTDDDPLDPDELLTVGLMREVLTNFVDIYAGLDDFAVELEGEDEELVMDYVDMIARLGVFYEALEAALEDAAA